MTDERKKKFIWGAKAIGKAAGLDTRQAYHLLQLGKIPGKKIGELWVSEEGELEDALSGQ